MEIAYYVEVNLICIAVLLLIKALSRYSSLKFSADSIAFNRLMNATIVLCFSDMVSWCLQGASFAGAKAGVEISNLILFECLTVISYLWMIYVFLRLKIITGPNRKKQFIRAIPLIVFTAIAISNPFTNILFSVNENNMYSRGTGVAIHWVISWLYLIISAGATVRAVLSEKNKLRRREIIPLLYFIVAPTAASILQMLFYGLTSTQVGVTFSILLIFLSEQNNQVLTDSLTGLNNRRGLTYYLNGIVMRGSESELMVMMLDINNFKQINDQSGHLIGDCALLDVADALKQVGSKVPDRLFLCRYGGDEFLLAGKNRSAKELADIEAMIREELEEKNRLGNRPYRLDVSIGISTGRCSDADDIDRLLESSDKDMYGNKIRRARRR